MEYPKPYFDLCVAGKSLTPQLFHKSTQKYLELGYRTIAVNDIYDENCVDDKRKQKKGQPRDVSDVPIPFCIRQNVKADGLKILNRLTIVFNDVITPNKVMKSETIKMYDIIALVATSQAALQYACSGAEADIISFDPENRPDIRLTRKLYNQAVERGLHFELMYAPAILDTSLRKSIIYQGHLYHSHGKSLNIIITSWSFNDVLIRGPHDVMNLGLIFGLTEQQSINAISHCSKNVIIHAMGRKLGKTVMIVKDLNKIETMVIDDDTDEEMGIKQEPALKRPKQEN